MEGKGEGVDKMEVVEEVTPINFTPGPNSVDISPEGKKGLLYKEVVKEGVGTPFEPNDPETWMTLKACSGTEVFVHYVGTLTDGTEFDRSNRSGDPFSFVLGDGKVIKAWDIGVEGMLKGEVRRLICHPDVAYGKTGSGKIPPNATLIFEVEMLDFQPEDLSKHKDKSILRVKHKAGKNRYLTPIHGSLVEVEYSGFEARSSIRFFDDVGRIKFKLGEGSELGVPYGVEKALYKFNEGEISVLKFKKHHKYMPSSVCENDKLPENPEFLVKVWLHSFDNPKEPWQLEGPEKLEYSKEFKEKGGQFFSKGNYRLALDNYKRIVDFLKAEALLHGEEEETRKSLLLASYLNQAMCNLKLNRSPQAIRNCDDALDMDKNNLKGLYRRGLARIGINEPALAKEDFECVLKMEPDNKAAQSQLKLCEKKITENKQREKTIFKKMFASIGMPEPSVGSYVTNS
uniref:peptidylprolyl isomerase n=1 Tax=Isotomurus palustris TaxID=36144 RepID=A0A481SZF2_9HEXA|nr:fk506-binding protein [Isotomurus palustris]